MQLLRLVKTPGTEAERLQRQEGRYVWLLLAALVPMMLQRLSAGGAAVLRGG